jgi:hypothetical protein
VPPFLLAAGRPCAIPHFHDVLPLLFGSLWIRCQHHAIDLPGADFTVRLIGVKADTVFSSRWSWTNLLQYDNVSEVLGINSRVHWQPRAGREVYLVYNYGLEDRDRTDGFRALNWDLSLKFSYNFRY